jgi:hypothetical protein
VVAIYPANKLDIKKNCPEGSLSKLTGMIIFCHYPSPCGPCRPYRPCRALSYACDVYDACDACVQRAEQKMKLRLIM